MDMFGDQDTSPMVRKIWSERLCEPQVPRESLITFADNANNWHRMAPARTNRVLQQIHDWRTTQHESYTILDLSKITGI